MNKPQVTFQGKPCKRGGHTERYIKSRRCVVCTNIDNKKWRAENPEKKKAGNKKWNSENPEKKKSYNKKWNSENPEKKKAGNKKWNSENPEKRKEWNAENPEKKKSYTKKWKKENSGLCNHHTAKRRAMKKQQTPPWADLDKIKEIYMTCPEEYEVDHIHPLSKGGLHVDYNLQHLPAIENRVKSAKL